MEDKVKTELVNSPYAPSALRSLTGGTANFIFHAILKEPLPDGTSEVAIKHGESYLATYPDFKLSTSRCKIEEECLKFLADLPPLSSSACVVGTPKLYNYNPVTNTQVQEYLPNAISLKEYALEHYQTPAASSFEPLCVELGQCLGQWLRSFHEWARQPAQAPLRKILSGNKEMQSLKQMINYQALAQKADQHPDTFGGVKDVLQQISDATAAELEDESRLEIIHGDFWTGNVLLPNTPLESSKQTPLKVIDWEMAQLGIRPLDLGQIIAELWQLKLYKDIDAGIWIIRGFVTGYGKLDDEFALRALLHVGAHLVCFGSTTPGWGTPEKQQKILEIGTDVLLKAWSKDRATFKGHALECLFS